MKHITHPEVQPHLVRGPLEALPRPPTGVHDSGQIGRERLHDFSSNFHESLIMKTSMDFLQHVVCEASHRPRPASLRKRALLRAHGEGAAGREVQAVRGLRGARRPEAQWNSRAI